MKKEIKHPYLMWVGTEHYPTIEDWTGEAVSMGISKRLPSASVAKKLMEDGALIFVAHDEGEADDCPKCMGEIDCPECRKGSHEANRIQDEVDKIKAPFVDEAEFEKLASPGQKRSVRIRQEKIQKIESDKGGCPVCMGTATLKAGTGGQVKLDSGVSMDYRTFNYHLHQPKKFDISSVIEREMCENCGGTGKLPRSKIFGMFVPERIEYILAGDETTEKLKEVEGFDLVLPATVDKEAKRGCGKRKAGGVYVASASKGGAKKAKKALAELVEAGIVKPEATEIHGNFVRFLEPIEVKVKRFRGIKTYSLNPDVEAAAEDVMDAMG
jgi:hypothetical protein